MLYYQKEVKIKAGNRKLPERFSEFHTRKYQKLLPQEEILKILKSAYNFLHFLI